MKVVRGAKWTDSKLDDVIHSINRENWPRVFDNYWELIPDGDFSDHDKMKFIVCAIPDGAIHPVHVIVTQLLMGPTGEVPTKDSELAKPNLLKAIKSMENGEEVVKHAAAVMRKHKHCPDRIKSNDDWCAILVLMELIDRDDCEYTYLWFYDAMKEYADEDPET